MVQSLGVAAAITIAAKAGDLRPGQEILRTQTCDAYSVSLYVAGAAIETLRDLRIARKYGAHTNLEDGDIEETLSRHRTGTMLDQIARHVAGLEDRISTIERRMPAMRNPDLHHQQAGGPP